MKTRNLIVIVLFLCQSTLSISQIVFPLEIDDFTILDSSRLVVKYNLDFIVNPEKPETIDDDIVVLEIGSIFSKSYSYGLYIHDSIRTANKNIATPTLQTVVPPIEVFKNYPKGYNTIVHRSPLQKQVFLYEDEINIQWKILPERKQISRYTCQRTIATFRGRKWEAWFTNQIPVSDGPWKFCGLPGLILEIADDKNHYVFTCISIRQKEVPIKKWNWNYQRSTRERVNNHIKRYAERPAASQRQYGVQFVIVGRSDAETEKYSFPYNPIELE